MEQVIVHGVRTTPAVATVTVVPDSGRPPAAAAVLRRVADLGVPVEAVAWGAGGAPLRFAVADRHRAAVAAGLRASAGPLGIARLAVDDAARVTLLGSGLRLAPAAVALFCETLARRGIPVDLLTADSHGIAAVCGRDRAQEAANALTAAFPPSGSNDSGTAAAAGALGSDQPLPYGVRHRVGPVAHLEPRHRVVQRVLHRVRGARQDAGDGGVVVPLGDE